MADFISSGPRIRRGWDLMLWILSLGILLLIPLFMGMSIPKVQPAGPIYNGSVLTVFLTLQGLIILASLRAYLMLWQRSAQGRSRRQLAGGEPDWINTLSKFIGALFIVSGFIKLQDITGFAYKLDEYWDVFGLAFLKPISIGLAWFISVFEVAIAFALMTGFRMRQTTFFMLGMIVFFTFLTGFSAITGSVTDCGCFGDALKLTPWQSFTKDVILLIAIIPLYGLRKKIPPFYRGLLPGLTTVLSFLLFGAISLYSFWHLPPLDFRGAYKVGQNLKYNEFNQSPGEELPIAHDFSDFCRECGEDGYSGATLYTVVVFEKACEDALFDMREFLGEMKTKAPEVKLCGGINMMSELPKFEYKYKPGICFSSQDEKALKTMIRSSPGYILLKDGMILAKWHHNDRPEPEEIKSMLQ